MEEIVFNEDGYNEDLLREVTQLCLLGHNDTEIADVLGIPLHRFNSWKKYKPFLEAYNAGKDRADARVVESLYKRATGMEYFEEEARFFKGEPRVQMVRRYLPPDVNAADKWLQRRQPKKWSDRHSIDITNTNVNINKLDFTGITDEQLMLLRDIGLKQIQENGTGTSS